MVGRYLMDSVGLGVSGQFPALEGLPPTNDDGQGTEHTYVPWWGYDKQKELGFPRGYHIEIGGGRRMPSMGMAGLLANDETSVGDALRAGLRQRAYTQQALAEMMRLRAIELAGQGAQLKESARFARETRNKLTQMNR